MNTRTTLLLAAAVAVTATAATAALKAGSWDLAVSRNAIRLSPQAPPGLPGL
ncbi:hypothetical protein ACWC4A_45700 [Streptomyces mirabilis]